MPLYEYRCTACQHQFEVIRSFSAKPLRKCEKCGGKVDKLISRGGFVLKGGGWYKSDYAPSKPSSPESQGTDSPGKDSPGKESSGKESSGDAPAAASSSEGTGSGGSSSSSSSDSKSSDGKPAKTPPKPKAAKG